MTSAVQSAGRTLLDTLPPEGHAQDSACMFERHADGWQPMTTAAWRDEVTLLALGLRYIGLRRGDRVGLLGRSSPHWIVMDLAIMSAGGVTVPVFARGSSARLRHQIHDCGMRFLLVESPQVLALAESSANLLHAIVCRGVKGSGARRYDYDALLLHGRAEMMRNPAAFEELVAALREDDLATIIYTSGSTGEPKGVELTQRNIFSQLRGAAERFVVDPASVALSFLPLAHVFERMIVYSYLDRGVPIYFVDDLQQVGTCMREVRPTVMTTVPRLLEKIHDRIVAQVELTDGLKGRLAAWALSKAEDDEPHEGSTSAVDVMADRLMYSRFRDGMGGRLQIVVCGGAPLAPELCRFFLNIGVPLYNGYGLTESSPVLCANYPGANRMGTVGLPFPDVELRLADDGVLEARGPNVMRGYHGRPADTAAVLDADGWLNTGDRASIDPDGFVTITGRAKELFKTSTGKYVCPIPIEQALRNDALIDMAAVIADNRKFVTCLLFPDGEAVRRMRERRGAAEDMDLLNGAELRDYMKIRIERINAGLEDWERIRAWRFVADPPTVENEQLTPTAKLRRHVIEDVHRELINSMYEQEHERK
jgi:long-chain acyl-CoA synthetase